MDKVFKASKEQLMAGLDSCMADWRVAALTNQAGNVLYDIIESSKDVVWEYTPTTLPPKKFFFPQEETILDYDSDGKITARIDAEPTVLFGIRPCDLNGIKILNEAFAEGHGDPNYLAKKEQAVVIGMECFAPCDEDAFCDKVGGNDAKGAFDLMLMESDSGFLITVATDKGGDFLKKYFEVSEEQGSKVEAFYEKKKAGFDKPFENLESFPEIFSKHDDHPIWKKEGERCLNCGSCVMVCPTCYCFDVTDEWDLSLKKGERVRKWDGCTLCDFAAVAGNENFRESKEGRIKHRMNRKFNYLMKKHGQSVCVGCGRCVRACLVNISPKTCAETMNKEGK